MWTQPMSKTLGVVAEAPMDWTHSELLPVFSCAAVVLGATTHFFGEWVRSMGLPSITPPISQSILNFLIVHVV